MSAAAAVVGRGQGPLWSAVAGVTLWTCLALQPLRAILEAGLVTHLLVQIPLLAAAGALLGCAISASAAPDLGGTNTGLRVLGAWMRDWNANGLPGTLLASFTAAFWMLPRSLDAALLEPHMAAAKLVTVPALLGLPLALSWPRLHAVARGFAWANLLFMLAVLGWLYQAAPVRLCNVYLLDEQTTLGRSLLALGAALGLTLVARAFAGHPLPAGRQRSGARHCPGRNSLDRAR